MASSSNSSGNNSSPYQVFINHHAPDTNHSIATHLYDRLHEDNGLQVFLCNEEMEKGDFLTSQISAAIREARVHIAIFSPGYADSEWCLDELLLMLESMNLRRSTVIPVFYLVTPADLRWALGENRMYAEALRRLQEKETTDFKTHQEWIKALETVSFISGFEYDGVEGNLVDNLVEVVLRKVKIPLHVCNYPTGLDQRVKDFEELLQQQSGGPIVMGIVGLGGVGKTTLAREIFNRLRSNYQHSSFLFDIRQNSLTNSQIDLLKDLSPKSNVQIRSEDEGIEILKKDLKSKEAVIVLDNVDSAQQLEALLSPYKDVLHPRSRILVTCRNQHLLINQDIKESSIYRVECLNEKHSSELFCLHAFDQPRPVAELDESVKTILKACGGLPLSLTVLGAHLSGKKDLSYWEAESHKISQILPDNIQSILKISYDSLDEEEQHIFLDIACFFVEEDKDTAIKVWEGSEWEGWLGFVNLENKFLVEVDSRNRIRMHDHLRDLGRGIGEKEPPLRLWRLTNDLLNEVRGIDMIEASVQNREELANHSHCLHRLKLLIIAESHDCNLDESIFGRSENLLWLRWNSCPYSSLPLWISMGSLRVLKLKGGTTLKTLWTENHNSQVPLQLREMHLIDISPLQIPKSIGNLQFLEIIILRFTVPDEFCLPDEFCRLQRLERLEIMGCSMKSLPDSFGNLTNLQHIELSSLSELKRLPDSFGELQNLQHINLSRCYKIESLPDSFGKLTKLQHIELCDLEELKRLPDSFGELNSLQHIDLSNSKIECLPYSFGELKNLQHINLSRCSKIESLPDSFGKLTKLQHIELCDLEELKRLPDSFGELNSLQHIDLSNSKIECLPYSFGELKNLQHINLSWSTIKSLPHSLGKLQNLRHINLSFCSHIKSLPNSFGNLKNLQHLDMPGCFEIESLPDFFGDLKNLQHFVLGASEIKSLPHSFRKLKNLQYIDLTGAKIESLPNFFGELNNLQHINLCWCVELKKLPQSFGELNNLQHIDLTGCLKLERLPDSFENLKKLRYINLFGCSKLQCLPDSFCNFKELQHLELENCSELNMSPETFGEINTLQYLNLSGCPKIQVYSLQVARNRLLRELFVINTNLKELPRDIGELTDLQVLHLGSQWLEMLPHSLGNLRSLQKLVLSNCGRLKCLPNSIILLTQLRELKIEKSGVEFLPPGFMELNSLEELRIEECPLIKLPFRKGKGVKCMLRLKHLELFRIDISEISFSEGVCPNLHYLRIDGCGSLLEVGALPTSLSYITLRDCCALRKVGGLWGLEKLQNLQLVRCVKVEELPPELERVQCDKGEELQIALREKMRELESFNKRVEEEWMPLLQLKRSAALYLKRIRRRKRGQLPTLKIGRQIMLRFQMRKQRLKKKNNGTPRRSQKTLY